MPLHWLHGRWALQLTMLIVLLQVHWLLHALLLGVCQKAPSCRFPPTPQQLLQLPLSLPPADADTNAEVHVLVLMAALASCSTSPGCSQPLNRQDTNDCLPGC